ncbi:unnamed protein product [Peronospora destructor]|uniref:Secreted protein n=1 Tax=Peronospora destructor TaxID=86335 RepID=A0AAV0T340_9STRA|nr:unnamed protein product [Peronospora destructor]
MVAWREFACVESVLLIFVCFVDVHGQEARLAQSVERKTLNLVVVGSSPTVGDRFCLSGLCNFVLVWCLRCIAIVCEDSHPIPRLHA